MSSLLQRGDFLAMGRNSIRGSNGPRSLPSLRPHALLSSKFRCTSLIAPRGRSEPRAAPHVPHATPSEELKTSADAASQITEPLDDVKPSNGSGNTNGGISPPPPKTTTQGTMTDSSTESGPPSPWDNSNSPPSPSTISAKEPTQAAAPPPGAPTATEEVPASSTQASTPADGPAGSGSTPSAKPSVSSVDDWAAGSSTTDEPEWGGLTGDSKKGTRFLVGLIFGLSLVVYQIFRLLGFAPAQISFLGRPLPLPALPALFTQRTKSSTGTQTHDRAVSSAEEVDLAEIRGPNLENKRRFNPKVRRAVGSAEEVDPAEIRGPKLENKRRFNPKVRRSLSSAKAAAAVEAAAGTDPSDAAVVAESVAEPQHVAEQASLPEAPSSSLPGEVEVASSAAADAGVDSSVAESVADTVADGSFVADRSFDPVANPLGDISFEDVSRKAEAQAQAAYERASSASLGTAASADIRDQSDIHSAVSETEIAIAEAEAEDAAAASLAETGRPAVGAADASQEAQLEESATPTDSALSSEMQPTAVSPALPSDAVPAVSEKSPNSFLDEVANLVAIDSTVTPLVALEPATLAAARVEAEEKPSQLSQEGGEGPSQLSQEGGVGPSQLSQQGVAEVVVEATQAENEAKPVQLEAVEAEVLKPVTEVVMEAAQDDTQAPGQLEVVETEVLESAAQASLVDRSATAMVSQPLEAPPTPVSISKVDAAALVGALTPTQLGAPDETALSRIDWGDNSLPALRARARLALRASAAAGVASQRASAYAAAAAAASSAAADAVERASVAAQAAHTSWEKGADGAAAAAEQRTRVATKTAEEAETRAAQAAALASAYEDLSHTQASIAERAALGLPSVKSYGARNYVVTLPRQAVEVLSPVMDLTQNFSVIFRQAGANLAHSVQWLYASMCDSAVTMKQSAMWLWSAPEKSLASAQSAWAAAKERMASYIQGFRTGNITAGSILSDCWSGVCSLFSLAYMGVAPAFKAIASAFGLAGAALHTALTNTVSAASAGVYGSTVSVATRNVSTTVTSVTSGVNAAVGSAMNKVGGAEGVKQGVSGLRQGVSSAVANIGGVEGVRKSVGSAVSNAGSTVSSLSENARTSLSKVGDNINSSVDSMKRGVGPSMTQIGSNISSRVDSVSRGVGPSVSQIGNKETKGTAITSTGLGSTSQGGVAVVDANNKAGGESFVSSAGAAVSSVVGQVGKTASQATSSASAAVSSAVEHVGKSASQATSFVGAAASSAGEQVGKSASQATSFVGAAASSAGEQVGKSASQATSAASDFASNAVTGMQQAVGSMWLTMMMLSTSVPIQACNKQRIQLHAMPIRSRPGAQPARPSIHQGFLTPMASIRRTQPYGIHQRSCRGFTVPRAVEPGAVNGPGAGNMPSGNSGPEGDSTGGALLSMIPQRFTKTVHLIRHGEGFHNVAGLRDHDEYASDEWFDAHLTEKGWTQAVGAFSEGSHDADVNGDAAPPLMKLSELSAGELMKPMSMEIIGKHPCDRRRSRTFYEKTFPYIDFSLLETEEDVMWTQGHRESNEEIKARALEFFEWLSRRSKNIIVVVSRALKT
eukprot:gene11676-34398_t